MKIDKNLKLLRINIYMKNLNQTLEKSLKSFLNEISKGAYCSWLSIYLEKHFKYNEQINNINKVSQFIINNSHINSEEELIIFPEPDWEIPEEWGITSPTRFHINELKKIITKDISIGLTNYYIVPTNLPPSWAIVFCHEGDMHLLSSAKIDYKKNAYSS